MIKILVTGANGMLGNAVRRLSESYNTEYEWIFIGREFDLTKEHHVRLLYAANAPQWVVHIAAKVGGIIGNQNGQADYFYHNAMMNILMLRFAHEYNVEKFVGFASVCIFPDGLPFLVEEKLHDGPVYHGNYGYGVAKRLQSTYISALKDQYGRENFCSIAPCNLYGPHDLYNLTHAHVIPSLIHRMYLAKHQGLPFTVMGDGQSRREFLYSDDLAKILWKILQLEKLPQCVIASNNNEYSIREIVDILWDIVGLEGEAQYDTSKPSGQRARPTDLTLLKSLIGEFEYTDIKVGLEKAYRFFEDNYPNVRL